MAKKNEDRVAAARVRLKLAMLYLSLQNIMFTWQFGVDGGGKHSIDQREFDFPALPVTPKEKLVIKAYVEQVNKTRLECLNVLIRDDKFAYLPKSFFEDLEYREGIVEGLTMHIMHSMSMTEVHKVTTYCYYAFLHDWMIITNEQRPEFDELDKSLGRFANHLIPHSRQDLVECVNAVYWATRDIVLDNPEWYEWEGPSEEERMREQEQRNQ